MNERTVGLKVIKKQILLRLWRMTHYNIKNGAGSKFMNISELFSGAILYPAKMSLRSARGGEESGLYSNF